MKSKNIRELKKCSQIKKKVCDFKKNWWIQKNDLKDVYELKNCREFEKKNHEVKKCLRIRKIFSNFKRKKENRKRKPMKKPPGTFRKLGGSPEPS